MPGLTDLLDLSGTSLDPNETKSHTADDANEDIHDALQTSDIAFRHSGWARLRHRVFDALCRVSISLGRLERFANCGSGAWVYRAIEDHDRYSVRSATCRDRWCQPCAQHRGLILAANLAAHCDRRSIRFVTLTLKHSPDPLRDQLDRLYRCFARLRRNECWASRVSGGAAVLEVTYNARAGTWHPHLHCLVEGAYIPHAELRSAWLRITCDSFVVDIRNCPDSAHAARYVAKYVAKPWAHSWINRPQQLDEAVLALHGRRACLTFGSWRGVLLTQTDTVYTWEPIAPLQKLLFLAATGEPHAVAILANLKGCEQCQDQQPARASPLGNVTSP